MGGTDGRSTRKINGGANARRFNRGARTSSASGSHEKSRSSFGQSDSDSFSASVPVPEDVIGDTAALEVTGLPPNVDVNCLRYYLEISTQFTAKVVSILFQRNRQSAVVRFSQAIDLFHVSNFCSEVPLDDDNLFIYVSEVLEASAIQIHGLEKPKTESYTQTIVENYLLKNSIKSAISKVIIADDTAVVALTSSTGSHLLVEAMQREPRHYRSVVPFYKDLGITLETDMINYTSGSKSTYTGTTTDGQSQPTLLIGGFSKPLASEKYIKMFFSNARSGGEDCVEELRVDDKMVVLRYAQSSVADRVIEKSTRKDLKFENDYLWIAVSWHRQHLKCDNRVFILRNLPGNVSRVSLLYFLWAHACSHVLSICFSLQRNMALVEFEPGANFRSLYSAIADGEFFRNVNDRSDQRAAQSVELLQVLPVTCLQFSGVPECGTEEYVELLVNETCKSHSDVEAHLDGGACALRLASQQEADIARFADFELEGTWLRVTPYHSMTGITTEDEMSVAWMLNAPLAVDFVDGSLLASIISLPARRLALDKKLRSVHARLVDPCDSTGNSGSTEHPRAAIGGWIVRCLVADLNTTSQESPATLRAQWKNNVVRVIKEFCSEFSSTPRRPTSNAGVQLSDGDSRSVPLGPVEAAAGSSLSINVRRRELRYLQYKKVEKLLKAKVSDSISVTLNPNGRISIAGPDDALQPAKSYIQALLAKLEHREVMLSVASAQLTNKENYQQLVQAFNSVGVAAFWEPAGDFAIAMCAERADDLQKAISVVYAHIKTFDVMARHHERSMGVPNSRELPPRVVETQCQRQRQAVVAQWSGDLVGTAAAQPNSRAIAELSRLGDSTHFVISINDILLFSLLRFHTRTIFGDKYVYLSFTKKDGGGEVIVSAPAALTSSICDEVRSNLDRVYRSWHLVSGQAKVCWLSSKIGQTYLSDLSRQSLTYSWYVKTEQLAKQIRRDDRRVVIVHGSALLQSGQCLMIGSNVNLELTSSITGQQLLAIDGQAIQNYIRKNSKKESLQVGDCVTTIASKWPFNAIVHIVCPTYKADPLAASNDLLAFALLNGFEAASNKKYSSIVLPSIGSDGFGYPPDIGAETLVKALNMHFDKTPTSSIRNVIVADMNKNAIYSVLAAVQKTTSPDPAKEMTEPEKYERVSANGLLVTIARGNIEQQQVDAIINCLLSSGNLNDSGIVSSRLSRAAGPELQQACRRLAPGSKLYPGQVVVTKGYGLPCQNVISVCCGDRYETVDTNLLSNYLTACLRQADELCAKTLAVPLLGSDTLNISSSAIAHATMCTLALYKAKTLKAVYCVVDDEASLETFRTQQREVLGSLPASLGANTNDMPSLCLTVLGLSRNNVEGAIAKVAAELRERESGGKTSSEML